MISGEEFESLAFQATREKKRLPDGDGICPYSKTKVEELDCNSSEGQDWNWEDFE